MVNTNPLLLSIPIRTMLTTIRPLTWLVLLTISTITLISVVTMRHVGLVIGRVKNMVRLLLLSVGTRVRVIPSTRLYRMVLVIR